ncbi:hypothetical protein [Paraburkholderia nodosa]|uniref:hypothetical protein n=1 Tax=Paraburkholderia nodosa TaxID=392320 RepID=UPI00114C9DC4|nr:hypothetical protein [Paraburkholderia nodosa]
MTSSSFDWTGIPAQTTRDISHWAVVICGSRRSNRVTVRSGVRKANHYQFMSSLGKQSRIIKRIVRNDLFRFLAITRNGVMDLSACNPGAARFDMRFGDLTWHLREAFFLAP